MSYMAVAPEASRVDPAAATAERLFQEHSGWVYGYCLRLLRSPEEAEDALQTTYLNACRSLKQGTRPQAGSAWLLRIAQNVCFGRLRSTGRRGRVERVQDFTVLEETVSAPERSSEALIGLTDALCSLPPRQREAILLREWQGLSYAEVAARLELSQAAVETLIFRARRSLASALENPEKPSRRKALHALDVGGLLAALKGFFAGSAGVKAVAAVTVAAATTATVVTTDPTGVWRDRGDPVAPRAAPAAPELARTSTARPTQTGPFALLPSRISQEATHPARKPKRAGERGRAFGQATAAAAKAKETGAKAKGKGQGNGNGPGTGKALGHAKTPSPQSPNAQGASPPAQGQPAASGDGNGPPPHAIAKGQAAKAD
jgi:RNA polymerase sigma-70 factor (ECF subfamily)